MIIMSLRARTVCPLALALLLAGCVPFPNYHYFAPAISGVVTRDGAPVEGARVNVWGAFATRSQVVVTGADGRFSAEPIRELRFAAWIVGDPLYAYSVEITAANEKYPGYSMSAVGNPSAAIELACDLAHTRQLQGGRQMHCVPVDRAHG
jgi:hypothetical protein